MTENMTEPIKTSESGRARSGGFLKNLSFLAVGIYFGIVLVKAEVVSWYRIQEMFHFQSFHMYGVIGSAVLVGALSVLMIRLFKLRSFGGAEIDLQGKPFNKKGNIIGGTIFGFGWALTGACPGPLYALFGAGYWTILLALAGAVLGALAYGYARPHLPH
jgi:hypothetical protein